MAHVVGPVRNAAALDRAAGIQVTGFVVMVENTTIRHTIRRHGDAATEGKRGQLPVTEDDLARLPRIMGEFDAAERVDETRRGAPHVRLRKRIGSIDYEVFVEIRRSARQVAFKTMIKRGLRQASS